MPKPRIIFDHDARHPLIYMYEPPIHKEEFESAVDELVGTPIEAISLMLGDARSLLYDTKAGERWGQNVTRWPHLIWRRAAQNFHLLMEEGNDPLRVVCDRAHANGMLVYAQLLAQQGARERMLRSWENEDHDELDWKYDIQPLEIGASGDVDREYPGYRCLNFKHQEVRESTLAVIEEVVANYPVDGFEVRFNYEPYYFHPDEVDAGRELMTEWVGRVYSAVKESGPDRELAIRVSSSLKDCLGAGLDPVEWVRRGIVDVLIPESPASADPNADFRPFVEVARGTKCRILAGLNSNADTDRIGEAPVEMVRGLACNYWAQEVDGLYLAHWFGQWPYRAPFYEKMRELLQPEVMAPKDKHYRISVNHGRETDAELPIDLEVGKPVAVELAITDNLPRWHGVGRVHEVLLRVRIGKNTELDRLSFKLNGEELPPRLLRKINEVFRLRQPRFSVHRGYWYLFTLPPEHWPVQGSNKIEVTLLERDPDLTEQIFLRDVELETKYLMGQNFHRGFVDPALGPYEGEGKPLL